MSGRVRGNRTRNWRRARVRVLGPSVEGRSYLGTIHGREAGVSGEWYRCTRHAPHKTEDDAAQCAQLALDGFLQAQRRVIAP